MRKPQRSRRPAPRRSRSVVLRSKFKQERRHRFMKAARFLVVSGVIIFGWLFVWRTATRILFHSPFFAIKSVEISGNRNVTAAELMALVPFRPGDNILTARVAGTQKNLRQCRPDMKSVSVSRGWRKIVVEVRERVPVACVMQNGQRRGIDRDNIPFPLEGPLYRRKLPEITGSTEERAMILDFMRTLAGEAKEFYPRVVRYMPEAVSDVALILNDGTRVRWGDTDKNSIRPKLARLYQVFADARARFTAVEYVDLCYFSEGRILVKPAAAAVQRGRTGQKAEARGYEI